MDAYMIFDHLKGKWMPTRNSIYQKNVFGSVGNCSRHIWTPIDNYLKFSTKIRSW